MTPGNDAHNGFEWDMTVVILLVPFIVFLLAMVIAIGPFGHVTWRDLRHAAGDRMLSTAVAEETLGSSSYRLSVRHRASTRSTSCKTRDRASERSMPRLKSSS
jgi:hypothetical protein